MAGLSVDERIDERNALASDGDEQPLEGAVENPLDDTVIDGRIGGLPPDYRREELETDTSAAEADERNRQEGR